MFRCDCVFVLSCSVSDVISLQQQRSGGTAEEAVMLTGAPQEGLLLLLLLTQLQVSLLGSLTVTLPWLDRPGCSAVHLQRSSTVLQLEAPLCTVTSPNTEPGSVSQPESGFPHLLERLATDNSRKNILRWKKLLHECFFMMSTVSLFTCTLVSWFDALNQSQTS